MVQNKSLRNIHFVVLVNEDEMEMIEEVARKMRRTKGASMRELLYREAERMGIDMPPDWYANYSGKRRREE